MQTILACVQDRHDQRLLMLAALVCIVGVYGASNVAVHAARGEGRLRNQWAAVAIVASACTAWATHMIGLLAFEPGMQSSFDPELVALSLVAAIFGIGVGVGAGVGSRSRKRRFAAGVTLGIGVAALHYIGQSSYLIAGHISWNLPLVWVSIAVSLGMFGISMMLYGERSRRIRLFGAPSLLASIALLHFCGMAAATLTFDPTVTLPLDSVKPTTMASVVAVVSVGLFGLALLGFRLQFAARARIRRDRDQLRELAGVALEGLAICDGNVIATANQSLENLLGARGASLTGRDLETILPSVDVNTLPEREEKDAELLSADGSLVPIRILRREVTINGRIRNVIAMRDQRERIKTEAHMRALAFSDPLTKLANRTRFNDVIAAHAASCRANGVGFTLYMVDLDRFKTVNDALGHAVGDALLCQVAMRLTEIVRSDWDLVARLGGDEFAIIHSGVVDQASIDLTAAQIVSHMSSPFQVGAHTASIGASVGVVVAPSHGDKVEPILQHADMALYEAKSRGRNTYCVFSNDIAERLEKRRVLAVELRDAINRREFEVHYQPLISMKSRSVTSAEALVRWRHPVRGLVLPSDFIPLAEEAGLIGEIGSWVLRQACADAASWPSHLRVAVNLSPAQFRDVHLVEVVRSAMAQAGLDPSRLELEITEGVLLLDEVRTHETLTRLTAMGIGLAMDDFGTGYSSLSYLRRFPFDKIKIDRSFVRNVPADQENVAVIRSVIQLARALGMSTTIEGIETAEQFAFAVREECDFAQGYLISLPINLGQFEQFIHRVTAAA